MSNQQFWRQTLGPLNNGYFNYFALDAYEAYAFGASPSVIDIRLRVHKAQTVESYRKVARIGIAYRPTFSASNN